MKIALKLPGGYEVNAPDLGSQGTLNKDYQTLGSVLGPLLNIVFYIVVFLAFYYLIWGAFQYILARGDKEGLHRARARITWALIGMIIVFSAYLIAKFAAEIFPPGTGGVPF